MEWAQILLKSQCRRVDEVLLSLSSVGWYRDGEGVIDLRRFMRYCMLKLRQGVLLLGYHPFLGEISASSGYRLLLILRMLTVPSFSFFPLRTFSQGYLQQSMDMFLMPLMILNFLRQRERKNLGSSKSFLEGRCGVHMLCFLALSVRSGYGFLWRLEHQGFLCVLRGLWWEKRQTLCLMGLAGQVLLRVQKVRFSYDINNFMFQANKYTPISKAHEKEMHQKGQALNGTCVLQRKKHNLYHIPSLTFTDIRWCKITPREQWTTYQRKSYHLRLSSLLPVLTAFMEVLLTLLLEI